MRLRRTVEPLSEWMPRSLAHHVSPYDKTTTRTARCHGERSCRFHGFVDLRLFDWLFRFRKDSPFCFVQICATHRFLYHRQCCCCCHCPDRHCRQCPNTAATGDADEPDNTQANKYRIVTNPTVPCTHPLSDHASPQTQEDTPPTRNHSESLHASDQAASEGLSGLSQ